MAISQVVLDNEKSKFVESPTRPNSAAVEVVQSVNEYINLIDQDGPITYVGSALPGELTSSATWSIQRITKVGTVTSVLFAGGNSSFSNVWDNRAALSYS